MASASWDDDFQFLAFHDVDIIDWPRMVSVVNKGNGVTNVKKRKDLE